jgi:hypothetical protein
MDYLLFLQVGQLRIISPFNISPGTAGVEPKISIVYNSQAGNGLLGLGWDLGGLSAIVRVPLDYFNDGISGGFGFNLAIALPWMAIDYL